MSWASPTRQTDTLSKNDAPPPPRGDCKGSDTDNILTFRGVHAFTVTAVDPEATGAVIGVAANTGGEINHVELTLSDQRRSELRSQAIENALMDARSQAATIAAA